MSNIADLIASVAKKAGVSEEQAKTAVETVVKFLKEKLPAPMASQLDSLMAGGEDAGGGAMDAVKKGLGGMFGG